MRVRPVSSFASFKFLLYCSMRYGLIRCGLVLCGLASLAPLCWAQPQQPVKVGERPFPELIFADSPILDAVARGDGAAVQAALAADPGLLNTLHTKSGYTPLSAALRAGNRELAQFFLDKGADLNVGRANNGPMMAAVQSGKIAMVQLLLDHGVDINDTGSSGSYSILYYPMQSDNKEMFEFLVRKGVDLNGVRTQYYSPYYAPLHQAIQNGKKDFVQILLDHNANVNPTNGYLPLMDAIQNGNKEIVQMLLAKGADINATASTNYYGSGASSPLQYAMQSGRREIVELIIDRADLKVRDRRGYTLLHSAVQAAQKAMVELLIQKGVDINARDLMGQTPLHLAVTGAAGLVETLIDHGANPNARDERGDTPLHLALRATGGGAADLIPKANLTLTDQYGLSPMLLALVNRKAEAHDLILARKPKLDNTALCFDAAAGDNVPELTRLLAQKPFLAFTRLGNGMTPLHVAALWGAHDAVAYLLKKGVDVNAKDSAAATPLHLALRRGSRDTAAHDAVATATLLLDKGANVNSLDATQRAPLHRAVLSQDRDLVELLLAHGANVDIRDEAGDTPLHLLVGADPAAAAREARTRRGPATAKRAALPQAGDGAGNALSAAPNQEFPLAAARLLVAKGADVNATDTAGETPLAKAAARTGTLELVTFLLDKGARTDPKGALGEPPLAKALTNNNMEIAKLLIERGADVNARVKSPYGDGGGEPLLLRVLNGGGAEAAKLLIAKGADVNARGANGETPLGRAINYGQANLDLVKLILDKGADLKGSVYYGESALHRAISYGNKELINLLLDRKMDVNTRDNTGNTALIRAVMQGNKDMVTVLLEHGADVNLKNANGQSALAHAIFYRNSPDIIDLLKQKGAKE